MSKECGSQQDRGRVGYEHDRLMDGVKSLIAALFVVGGVFAYYFFDRLSYVRAFFPVIGVIVALIIVFFFCTFGKNLVIYVRDATREMTKVVWPDKPTTLRMSLTVIMFVVVLALFMAMADGLISWVLFDLFLHRG